MMCVLMQTMLLQIDGGAIITGLIESSPTMAVAGLFGWYMYRQSEKKDLALAESEKVKTLLTERLIDDKEKRVISEQQQIGMLKSIIEKTGTIPAVIEKGIERLERNQESLKEEIKALRNVG